MFHQTFSLLDVPKVLILIFLECILSADNALIIAAIIKPLPLEKRNKALLVGVGSAIILRILAIFFVAYFIRFFWIQILGSLYLLYLAIAYRIKSNSEQKTTLNTSSSPSFWRIVFQLECVDFIFAFDSIIAALGLVGISISSEAAIPPKLWIVYLGGIIGLVLMRFSAKLFSVLMDKLHNLEKASHYLIGWVAIKLGFECIYNYFYANTTHKIGLWVEIIFWIGIGLLLLFGFTPKRKK